MTAKERANKLIEDHEMQCYECGGKETAITHAIITVDQIILEQCKSSELKDAKYQLERIDYWMQVKTELIKI